MEDQQKVAGDGAIGDCDTPVHSLLWLVVANAVGVLLAAPLVWPALHGLLGNVGYGRLEPVHLNMQLYGWCAVPLLGALMQVYLPAQSDRRRRRLILDLWSIGLLVGVVSWLSGQTSGKIFLDWDGVARYLFCGGMLAIWGLLCQAQITQGRSLSAGKWLRWGLLLLLLPVPFIMLAATSPALYPPVNPETGGPTGVSLLRSSLGLAGIFMLLPWMLRLPQRSTVKPWILKVAPAALILHFCLSALAGEGNASHRDWAQIAAMASLLIWVPILKAYLGQFVWHRDLRPWLMALYGWGGLLTVSGVVLFMPGLLERVKFTNILVGHSHLAMAGMVTSLNMLILLQLAGDGSPFRQKRQRLYFWCWHGGCILYIAAVTWVGLLEVANPGALFTSNVTVSILYGLRLIAGAAMTLASWQWLRQALPVRAEEHTKMDAATSGAEVHA